MVLLLVPTIRAVPGLAQRDGGQRAWERASAAARWAMGRMRRGPEWPGILEWSEMERPARRAEKVSSADWPRTVTRPMPVIAAGDFFTGSIGARDRRFRIGGRS